MQDKKYLLSIVQLLEMETATEQQLLVQRCFRWLDTERFNRVKRLLGGEKVDAVKQITAGSQMNRKLAEHIGAGMLLQLAILQAETEDDLQLTKAAARSELQFGDAEMIELSIQGLLVLLEQSGKEPVALEYTYGDNGKPYLKNYPYYFNLSHSGEYIFCVISEDEVGVDIQRTKPLKDDRIARRFFSEEEKQALAACSTAAERQELFYRLWACKEAYGKLTGRGIAATLDTAMESLKEFVLREYQIKDYQIAVCKWKQES